MQKLQKFLSTETPHLSKLTFIATELINTLQAVNVEDRSFDVSNPR